MQTITDLSVFNLENTEPKLILSVTAVIKIFNHVFGKVDWSGGMLKIEKWTNRLCLVIVFSAALYFAPIVINILSR